MLNHRRILSAGVALLALALGLAGCTTPAPGSSAQAQTTLVIGGSLEQPSLDITGNSAASIPQVLLYNVYETLVKIDGDGKMQPLLAKEWTVSPDRLTYTFHLADAVFASGNPVRAADVVWSIQRLRDGLGTGDFKAQMADVSSLRAVDDATVEVKLAKPSNAWLTSMASSAGVVIDSVANPNLQTTAAGSGPYVVKEVRKGESIVLAKNAKYWGKSAAFNEVTFRWFGSDATALNNAMLSGDIDIISNVQAPQAIARFADTSRYTVLDGTTQGEVVLGFNNGAAPLSNLKVRQAIMYAIDRKALMDTVWNGKGTLIGSMVPPTDPWYEDLTSVYPYDPAKAKALVAESGVTTPIRLRLRLPALPYAAAAGQFVTSQLKDVGIQVTTDTLEFPAWLDKVFTKADYDMTIVAHVEPRDLVAYANPQYYWRYNNPRFAQLVAEADAGDEATQVAKLKEAARLLTNDAASDWLFLLPNLIVTKSTITGVNKNLTTLSFDLTRVTATAG